MTRFHKDYVLCPHCASEESVVIWERVLVQEDPDLKERILKKDLQAFECSNCGETVIMAEPFLYIDNAAKQVFYYCPEYKDLLDDNRALVQTIPLPKASELLGLPEAEASDYRLRLLTTYNDLIEKIHLQDAGLDDRLMELVKLAMRTRLLEAEGKKLSDIYFLLAENEGMLFQVLEEESGWNSFETSREAYDNALKMVARDLPPDTGWLLVDLQWALDYVS